MAPPLPIPNRAVKHTSVDDTWTQPGPGKVDHRQSTVPVFVTLLTSFANISKLKALMPNPNLNTVGVVVLAAGKGKRMGGTLPLPKVLYPLGGRPMIEYLLHSLGQSVVKAKPVIVIAPDLFVIRETLGGHYDYAVQESQLGTGHAVMSAKDKLQGYSHILVLYGDNPLLSTAFINLLVQTHLQNGQVLTSATLTVPDFEGWRSTFANFGRIIRDGAGNVTRVVEVRDATEEERAITEVNTGSYMFKASWLWSALPRLGRNNIQGEYYITDLLGMALAQEKQIKTVSVLDAREALGINTPEQLAFAESALAQMASAPQSHLPI